MSIKETLNFLLILISIIFLILYVSDFETVTIKQNKTIIIKTLGDVSQQTLNQSIYYIENLTDFKCQISNEKYKEENTTDVSNHFYKHKNSHKRYNQNEPIEIIFCKANLLHNKKEVRGTCFGNTIYVKEYNKIQETIIHEILHSFSLKHCNNNCIMNSHCRKRWDHKTDKPIICSQHKIQLKNKFPKIN